MYMYAVTASSWTTTGPQIHCAEYWEYSILVSQVYICSDYLELAHDMRSTLLNTGEFDPITEPACQVIAVGDKAQARSQKVNCSQPALSRLTLPSTRKFDLAAQSACKVITVGGKRCLKANGRVP